MKKLRILTVWDGDYPWDVRVEKICKTLIAAGHEAHLVCRNSNAKPRREVIDGIQVRRVFAFNKNFPRLNAALTFPAFFSPLWAHEIRRAIKEIRPDAIIIRDLPIALAVVPWAKAANIPTVLDMAECYPEMIRCAWKFDKFRISNIFVRNPYLADVVEKITINNVNNIWVMIEESAERLVSKGVSPEKIKLVSNTPAPDSGVPEQRHSQGDLLRIVYVGLINPSRGLATVVKAAKVLKDKKQNFQMKIVGSGKDFPRISQMVRDLGLGEQVELTGWIDHKLLSGILDQSDIGLVPHYSCSHWNNTIPNKIFDYMKARIPVIVSDVRPAKRVVEGAGCGLAYKDTDENDLAEKIISLKDESLRQSMGKNGYRAIEEKYNWNMDSATLLQSLQIMAGTGGNR